MAETKPLAGSRWTLKPVIVIFPPASSLSAMSPPLASRFHRMFRPASVRRRMSSPRLSNSNSQPSSRETTVPAPFARAIHSPSGVAQSPASAGIGSKCMTFPHGRRMGHRVAVFGSRRDVNNGDRQPVVPKSSDSPVRPLRNERRSGRASPPPKSISPRSSQCEA